MKISRTHVATVLAALGVASANGAALRADANETVVFSRELDHVISEVVDYDYPEFRARDFIPVAQGVPPGAETFTWYGYDRVGVAKMLTNYADDIPNVTAFAEKHTTPIEGIAVGFSYSVQDVRAAALTGRPLDRTLAVYAREAIERKIESIAATGDSTRGVPGMLNNSSVALVTAGINGDWQNAATTGQQILEDLHLIPKTVWINSKQVHKPDVLILGTTAYAKAATKLYSSQTPDTVLDVFLRTSKMVRTVDSWVECDLADAEGNGERAVCYARDARNLELVIPIEFLAHAPQAKGLMFEVPCEGRIGGVVLKRPLSMVYCDALNDA